MGKKKILIIDDEADLVVSVQLALQAQGYEISTAYDGQEGLDRLKEERPDLIILDVSMPNMDGYTFLQERKAIPSAKNIPVIMYTGRDQMKELFEAEGVMDYIAKPFETEDLIKKVIKHLGQ